MKRRPLLTFVRQVGWAAPALLAATATGQDAGDRVRLDDFAVPQAAQAPRIDQVSAPAAAIDPTLQTRDRQIAAPAPTAMTAETPDQLSSDEDSGRPDQLSNAGQSRNLRTGAVSSTADSGPGAVVRIGGRDRCDPQLDRQALARCLQILELRANEYNAPAPPRLSAEETLLAEQRTREEGLARGSAALRVRYATMTEPDADLQTNQELASIYLPGPAVDTEREPVVPAEEQAEGLAAILGALGLEGAGQGDQ